MMGGGSVGCKAHMYAACDLVVLLPPLMLCRAGPGPWRDPAVLAQLEQQRQQRIAEAGQPEGMTVPEQLLAAAGTGSKGQAGAAQAAEEAVLHAAEPAALAVATM